MGAGEWQNEREAGREYRTREKTKREVERKERGNSNGRSGERTVKVGKREIEEDGWDGLWGLFWKFKPAGVIDNRSCELLLPDSFRGWATSCVYGDFKFAKENKARGTARSTVNVQIWVSTVDSSRKLYLSTAQPIGGWETGLCNDSINNRAGFTDSWKYEIKIRN